MFAKIRIIVHQHVTNRLCEEFFVPRLFAEHFDVMFYDLTDIYHKGLAGVGGEFDFVKKFSSLKELESQLKTEDIPNTLFIPYFTYEYKVIDVYRLFTKYNCPLGFMGRGMLPAPNLERKMYQVVLSKLTSILDISFMRRAVGQLTAAVIRKKGFIKKVDYVFNAGRVGHLAANLGYQNAIPFNSTDYSRFLKIRSDQKKIIEGAYAVFIDEYLPYHPDVQMLGIKSVDADKYYTSINSFLDKFEEETGVNVVIAAHPKSAYTDNPYGRRPMFKGATEALIKDATLVIDHFSTAISYAILNYKPLLIVCNKEIERVFPDLVRYAVHVSTILDTPITHIDDYKAGEHIPQPAVNRECYDRYKYDYLTLPEAENEVDEDLFITFLKSGIR